jgi:hypothetical protein
MPLAGFKPKIPTLKHYKTYAPQNAGATRWIVDAVVATIVVIVIIIITTTIQLCHKTAVLMPLTCNRQPLISNKTICFLEYTLTHVTGL